MLIVWVATKIHEQPKLEPYGADIPFDFAQGRLCPRSPAARQGFCFEVVVRDWRLMVLIESTNTPAQAELERGTVQGANRTLAIWLQQTLVYNQKFHHRERRTLIGTRRKHL